MIAARSRVPRKGRVFGGGGGCPKVAQVHESTQQHSQCQESHHAERIDLNSYLRSIQAFRRLHYAHSSSRLGQVLVCAVVAQYSRKKEGEKRKEKEKKEPYCQMEVA